MVLLTWMQGRGELCNVNKAYQKEMEKCDDRP